MFNNNTHEELMALNEVNSTIPGKIEYYSVNTSLSPFISCNSTSNGMKLKKMSRADSFRMSTIIFGTWNKNSKYFGN